MNENNARESIQKRMVEGTLKVENSKANKAERTLGTFIKTLKHRY